MAKGLAIAGSELFENFEVMKSLRKGVYTFNGYLTNKTLSKNFKIPFKDLNLIMSTL